MDALTPVSQLLELLSLQRNLIVEANKGIYWMEASLLAKYVKIGTQVHFDPLFQPLRGSPLANQRAAANCSK